MLSNRPTDSEAEIALRRALQALGLRYRKHVLVATRGRSVRVDLVFSKPRVAVFVDGCFWHACPKHATWPRRHGAWWRAKLSENVARDARQTARLRAAGWRVVRVWAHEKAEVAGRRILRALTLGRS
jgi:DNA mismatch endonuclease (patch repair protein)